VINHREPDGLFRQFFLIVLFIGVRFTGFVRSLETGLIPDFNRPPGVEAFLPISALVSLKHFLLTGIINDIHPSALVIFLIAIVTAVFVKKGFCAWVCPIGTLSEWLHKVYLKIFRHPVKVYRPIDMVLRSLKYLIAGFFIYSIFLKCRQTPSPGSYKAPIICSPISKCSLFLRRFQGQH